MIHIVTRNINGMFPEALWRLNLEGAESTSRNGLVMKLPFPAILEYSNPMERVLFEPRRDANPFFHLFEAIWMISGSNDLMTPAKFVPRMREYSDDGTTLNGAYGFRWREHFGVDQLDAVIKELTERPDSRRAVVAMWDPAQDLPLMASGGKDLPCNTTIYFSLRVGDQLDMTVCNRSNDLVWGACGANAVHMSFLQEYVARGIGVDVGVYYQFTNDLHLYQDHFKLLDIGAFSGDVPDPYNQGVVHPVPLYDEPGERKAFDEDCRYWLQKDYTVVTPYFIQVVMPLLRAWESYKKGDILWAMQYAQDCGAPDWRRAAMEWLKRRKPAL